MAYEEEDSSSTNWVKLVVMLIIFGAIGYGVYLMVPALRDWYFDERNRAADEYNAVTEQIKRTQEAEIQHMERESAHNAILGIGKAASGVPKEALNLQCDLKRTEEGREADIIRQSDTRYLQMLQSDHTTIGPYGPEWQFPDPSREGGIQKWIHSKQRNTLIDISVAKK